MHVVLVSSPGATREPHWSRQLAAALTAELQRRAVPVTWLDATRRGQPVPPRVDGFGADVVPARRLPALWRVAADSSHLPMEVALTRVLRHEVAARVVHLGVGARGSPNVCWLAERLGATPFAVAHAEEVLCHRGDLVHRDGQVCKDALDPDRCRRCCRRNALLSPSADAFRNRRDLLAASLQACRAVFVPAAADVPPLAAFGVPLRSLTVAADATAIAAVVTG